MPKLTFLKPNIMKKILFFSAACTVVIAMSSCRKNRVCTCTYLPSSGYTGSDAYTIPLSTKKNAKALCEADSDTYMTCELN